MVVNYDLPPAYKAWLQWMLEFKPFDNARTRVADPGGYDLYPSYPTLEKLFGPGVEMVLLFTT